MITICQIDPHTMAWTGEAAVIEDGAEVPVGWVPRAPPKVEEGPGPGDIVDLSIGICRLDLASGVFAGETARIAENGPCPMGWVRAEPPQCGAGERWIWTGEGWAVASTPGTTGRSPSRQRSRGPATKSATSRRPRRRGQV